MRNALIVAGLMIVPVLTSPSKAGTTALVDFENTPSIPQGPSQFDEAGPTQTITVPGIATFTGGVVLGDATNFPAISFSTAPNAYATASSIADADPSLQSALTISVAPGYAVDEVSFPVFNGLESAESYTVTAFDGSQQVAQQVLSNLLSTNNSGHEVVDLTAGAITKVTITPQDTTTWDFAIDSVAFNEPVSSAITPTGTPIPPSGGTTAVPLPPAGWPAAAMCATIGIFFYGTRIRRVTR